MKKIIFTFLSFLVAFPPVNAQKGINFYHTYGAGGRLTMHVDSVAKNVYYGNKFPNQPRTSFNYLPDVNNISVQMYFQKSENPRNHRYTILMDDVPIVVNEPIDTLDLQEVVRKDYEWKEEVLDSISLGIFPIKGRTLTILTYDVLMPQDVYKTVFYGKPIPNAKIEVLATRFTTEKGVEYRHVTEPNEKIDLIFTEKDEELTIVKEKSGMDYLYSISIKDKKTGELIFGSTSWLYGGYLSEADDLSPYVKIDNNIFRKSGEYEIIIQPMIRWDSYTNNHLNYDLSPSEIEKYTARYTLAITLDQESYTKKELVTFLFIAVFSIGLVFFVILYATQKRNRKKLGEKEQQKNMTKLQLHAIRSQLNPHFVFNALAGIQNLMNKNEIDHANKYLSKFARLTRNVLDDKEVVSLLQEKVMLDDYLQMEQLRFGFQYQITHSEDLDLDNVEIPSMLLQPFAENAVKHGVSKNTSSGQISVEFIRHASDLVLTVADNGRGFDTEKNNDGWGLRLSERREALLNSIYKENRIALDIRSTTKGTKISLTLSNWL